jgi:hypothetical protein
MMLRASTDRQSSAGQSEAEAASRSAILEHFVAAVVGDDPMAADDARAMLVDRLGADWLVDASAVIANFEMMTRLADATGARLRPEQIEAAASLIDDDRPDAFGSSKR